MIEVRPAGLEDRELVARIAADGFFDDPVMSWVFRDPVRRLDSLVELFGGLFDDMVPDRGTVHVLDAACTALWRMPDFEEARPASERIDDAPAPPTSLTAEEIERLKVLGGIMSAGHPHERHWYLNVVSTLPSRQSQGLGAAVLAPVLDDADDNGWPCYLESSNPRNVSLYLRHGFVETGQLQLPDGPYLTQMWREPQD